MNIFFCCLKGEKELEDSGEVLREGVCNDKGLRSNISMAPRLSKASPSPSLIIGTGKKKQLGEMQQVFSPRIHEEDLRRARENLSHNKENIEIETRSEGTPTKEVTTSRAKQDFLPSMSRTFRSSSSSRPFSPTLVLYNENFRAEAFFQSTSTKETPSPSKSLEICSSPSKSPRRNSLLNYLEKSSLRSQSNLSQKTSPLFSSEENFPASNSLEEAFGVAKHPSEDTSTQSDSSECGVIDSEQRLQDVPYPVLRTPAMQPKSYNYRVCF